MKAVIRSVISDVLRRVDDSDVASSVAPPIPVLVSAEIPSDDNNGVYVEFDLPFDVDATSPADSAFVITLNSIPETPVFGGYAGDNNEFLYLYRTDGNVFSYGDVVTVSYTKPALNPLKGIAGGEVESFVDVAVVNNIAWPALAPSGLTLTVDSDTQITANWINNDLFGDGTKLEISTDNFVTDPTIIDNALGVTSEVVTGLTAGTLYYGRIRAYLGGDYSEYSDVYEIWTSIDTLIADGNSLARYKPDDSNYVTSSAGVETIYWDVLFGKLSTLSAEQNSGSILLWGLYIITATEANYFYVGCLVGDFFICETVKTCNANNKVQRYLGNHLGQPVSAKRPINQVFNGTSSSMKTAAFSWNQPNVIYMILRQITWTSSKKLFDGNSATERGYFVQSGVVPKVIIGATSDSAESASMILGAWSVVRIKFNGANSSLQINNETAITGDFGTQTMNGFTLAAAFNLTGWGNIQVKDIILRNGDVNETQIYNALNRKVLSLNSHTELADMPSDLNQHGFETCDGKIYAIGGNKQTGGSVNVKTVYEYDPSTNTWTSKTPIPIAEDGCQSPILRAVGDKLYLIGGLLTGNSLTNKCFEYTPSTDTWVEKTAMPTVREDFGSAVIGTKIYCFGGLTNPNNTLSKKLEIYDTATDTWDTTKSDMPGVKWSGDFGAACNGKIYAIGGSATNLALYPVCGPSPIVYEYDPAGNTWATKTPMPYGAQYRECAVIGTDIYVVSGQISGDYNDVWTKTASIYKYNVLTDTWTLMQPAPYADKGIALAVLNNEIYMSGGLSTKSKLYKLNLTT